MAYEYKGVIHVHSTYSDGFLSVDKIMKEAQAAGLDFVMLTDHNTLRPLKDGYEGWYGSSLLLIGTEITPKDDKHHLMAFGVSREIEPSTNPQENIDAVRAQGGFCIIAHPHTEPNSGRNPRGARMHWMRRPRRLRMGLAQRTSGDAGSEAEWISYPWEDWSVHGFAAIEIWNYTWDVVEDMNTIPRAIRYFFFPERAVTGPAPRILRKWDELMKSRRVIGIGGVDAHGFPFSYRDAFKTVRTHVLLDRPLTGRLERDRTLIYDAIRSGSCFVGFDREHDSTSFVFEAVTGRGSAVRPGGRVRGSRPVFRIEAPYEGSIRLIRDGEVMGETVGTAYEHKAEGPGMYRVEAYYKVGRHRIAPWVFTNHIIVG